MIQNEGIAFDRDRETKKKNRYVWHTKNVTSIEYGLVADECNRKELVN